ncbi:hypothetical protein NYR72_12530 [Actinobacillus equuli subsp. haemolyticus]|uniref:hypothetical protein n=1 Tax=Actinobacillus equuli TaxID=718 RepID=UPI0024187C9D|nr:hypothetical protein [Actinobacillus equuli]MDG4949151.1 hypothetical protein [Actinobacillus equuli subsp. haemolyticus]MDG4949158.1 hypothetical protein [Actinobacillus equuli subsp. haemolyticus]MDG4949283.1 hypothetical protein [Actinobacillus equuli subsp. haemolyticus]
MKKSLIAIAVLAHFASSQKVYDKNGKLLKQCNKPKMKLRKDRFKKVGSKQG